MRKTDLTAEQASSRLLALFLWLVSLLFKTRVRSTSPIISHAPAPRVESRREVLSAKMGIPARYVDIALMSDGIVPFDVLFGHVRGGGRTREDAYAVLAQRIPDAADFLYHVRKWKEDSSLTKALVLGDDHATIDKVLHAAVAWREGAAEIARAKGPQYDFAAIAASEVGFRV